MSLTYNTQKEKMRISEYGRNVQNLINKAIQVKDREERNAYVEAIIKLMGQLSPHLRNGDELKRKLWDHLFIISDYKLDADSPYEIPHKLEDTLTKNIVKLNYPTNKIRFKHYGKSVESMIRKAIGMDDVELQMEFTLIIANYMKLVYSNWNRENVTDQMIKNDIRLLSDGKLILGDEVSLDTIRITRKSSSVTSRRKQNYRGKRSGSNSGGSGKKTNFRRKSGRY